MNGQSNRVKVDGEGSTNKNVVVGVATTDRVESVAEVDTLHVFISMFMHLVQ